MEYDYLILGSGMAGLSVGALLANAGKKVCFLEQHETHGGYVHTFKMNDFAFCAQIHYIWGAEPGGTVYEFLKKIGVDVKFNKLDPEGYDHMIIKGHRVKIPNGYNKLIGNITEQFPNDKKAMEKFISILRGIKREVKNYKDGFTFKDMITRFYEFPHLIKYKGKTVQEVFDACKLSQEVQTILMGQAGDFCAPPNELSILAYSGLFGGYNDGAYYPENHFEGLIDGMRESIEKRGGNFEFNTRVVGIKTEDKSVVSVEAEDVQSGEKKTFTAKNYICNIDPKFAAKAIGWEKFPKEDQMKLSYKYSPSAFTMYLGVKDLDLKKLGFGNWNVWTMQTLDINQDFANLYKNDFDKNPWFFLSTPTLNTKDKSHAPKGCDIIETATLANYDYWKNLRDNDYAAYAKEKNRVANILLDAIEKWHIPNLRDHIVLKVVGTPATNERFCGATFGNAYGSHMTPDQVGLNRLKADTPFDNLWWCNASSGYAGVHGTMWTGTQLYMKLTGDKFFSSEDTEFRKNASLLSFLKLLFRSW